jgi:hypothetical protein
MGAAADRVWAMVSGVPSGKRERRKLMVLQAYIDDSGNEPQSPVFVLAGFVASHESWAAFSDEWQSALSEPPGVAYFKMAQAERLHDEFERAKGWNEKNRDSLLIYLSELIKKYALFRVHTSVRHDAFDKWIKSIKTPSRNSAQDNPYFILFHSLIQICAAIDLQLRPNEKMDFIFDEHGSIGQDSIYYWNNFVRLGALTHEGRDLPNLLAAYTENKPIFRDERCFLPLQAADLYAWQLRRNFVEEDEGKPTRRPLEIIQGLSDISMNLNETFIREFSRDLIEVREQFIKDHPGTQIFGPKQGPRRKPFGKS